MQFLYFVPTKNTETLQDLLYAFESTPIDREILRGGPNGGRGFLYVDSAAAHKIAQITYDPKVQTWRKFPGKDIWVGYFNDNPPTPSELIRKDVIDGYNVNLGDGNSWKIPTCRYFGETGYTPALPQVMDIDEDGNWTVGNIVAKHKKLWDVSCQWFDLVASFGLDEGEGAEVDMSVADVADACVVALGTNYRVSIVEVGLLGLLTSETRTAVMNSTIDFQAVEEWSKKKEQLED
tara:strand:+ start:1546 stop:2250 length:705 start_codon:yes stop_codon:yes gene_type:complete